MAYTPGLFTSISRNSANAARDYQNWLGTVDTLSERTRARDEAMRATQLQAGVSLPSNLSPDSRDPASFGPTAPFNLGEGAVGQQVPIFPTSVGTADPLGPVTGVAPTAEAAPAAPASAPTPTQSWIHNNAVSFDSRLGPITFTPVNKEGQSDAMAARTTRQNEQAFELTIRRMAQDWYSGDYGNKSPGVIAGIYGGFADTTNADRAAREKANKVYSWITSPEARDLFYTNQKAFFAAKDNPEKAYDEFGPGASTAPATTEQAPGPQSGLKIPDNVQIQPAADVIAVPAAYAQAPLNLSQRSFLASVDPTLRSAAAEQRLPQGFLTTLLGLESSYGTNLGSRKNVMQFDKVTAAEVGYTLAELQADPNKAIDAAAKLAAKNRTYLTKALGREPEAWELYLAHQQGKGGSRVLLRNPNMNVVDALTIAYNGNKSKARQAVTQNGGDVNMTAGEFAGLWRDKYAASDALIQMPDAASVQPTASPIIQTAEYGNVQVMPAADVITQQVPAEAAPAEAAPADEFEPKSDLKAPYAGVQPGVPSGEAPPVTYGVLDEAVASRQAVVSRFESLQQDALRQREFNVGLRNQQIELFNRAKQLNLPDEAQKYYNNVLAIDETIRKNDRSLTVAYEQAQAQVREQDLAVAQAQVQQASYDLKRGKTGPFAALMNRYTGGRTVISERSDGKLQVEMDGRIITPPEGATPDQVENMFRPQFDAQFATQRAAQRAANIEFEQELLKKQYDIEGNITVERMKQAGFTKGSEVTDPNTNAIIGTQYYRTNPTTGQLEMLLATPKPATTDSNGLPVGGGLMIQRIGVR